MINYCQVSGTMFHEYPRHFPCFLFDLERILAAARVVQRLQVQRLQQPGGQVILVPLDEGNIEIFLNMRSTNEILETAMNQDIEI